MKLPDPRWLRVLSSLVFTILVLALIFSVIKAWAEEVRTDDANATVEMTVIASLLNGRAAPRKRSPIEAKFDCGDVVEALRWSRNKKWVEVKGGETGTVWVWWEYLTERLDYFYVWNDTGGKVKIRKRPGGTVIGYLKPGKELLIDQVVFGWGKCRSGWVDLKYLTEED